MTKTILVRFDPQTAKINPCGICLKPVILDNTSPNIEEWTLTCDCGTVTIPQWCIVDPVSRRKYLKNFKNVTVQ